MSSLTESARNGAHVVSEAAGTRSREQGVLILGQDLVGGTVLGKITASGKWTQLDTAAVDGSENAAGVLLNAVDATDADAACVVHVRDCELSDVNLTWPDGIIAGDKTAATTALAALGVIVR